MLRGINSKRIAGRLYTLGLLSIALFCPEASAKSILRRPLVWTMANVNRSHMQGDAHLIELPDGKVLLIDSGYQDQTQALIKLLEDKKIRKVDLVLISHAHRDHYEGLEDLMTRKISLGTVYFNVPNKFLCNDEKPWGCDFDHVTRSIAKLRKYGAKVRSFGPGETLYSFDGGGVETSLRVLHVFDAAKSPVGKISINDTSAVAMLKHGSVRVLFTGDLNHPIGDYLVKNDPASLKADILKVPHHGLESVANNSFFDAVDAKVALVPVPAQYWVTDRAKRVREYFASKKVPTYTNGLNGNVTVRFESDRFEICPEILEPGTSALCREFNARTPEHSSHRP